MSGKGGKIPKTGPAIKSKRKNDNVTTSEVIKDGGNNALENEKTKKDTPTVNEVPMKRRKTDSPSEPGTEENYTGNAPPAEIVPVKESSSDDEGMRPVMI